MSIALLVTAGILSNDALRAEDCRAVESGTCTRRADMDTSVCLSMSGSLVDSCFTEGRSQYQFQCQFATESGNIAITYFDESKSEKEAQRECKRLKGKLSSLKTFVSRKPSLDRGKLIYEEKGCATCHGIRGGGDGPVSTALKPVPTDFTRGFLHGDDLEAIIRAINDGIPNTGMAPYVGVLEDYEIADVARYVRLFYKKKSAPEKHK